MRKPYEKDWRYSWARIWCDDAIRSMFNRITVEGKENVPTDGAVLLAPNHCNTLMDALAVLQDWKEATLFGARADIFRKPFINKLLRFLKILPIPRVRDGIQEVLNNRKTMDEVVECLDHGMKYCMFCEGTHRPKHSLLPLRKGIVRTALLANDRFGSHKPVYIVPVGLEYQDYYRIKTPLTIRYGEAINVSEYVAAHQEEGTGKIYRSLLAVLKDRLSKLITCLPYDETYDGRWCLTKIAGQEAAMAADEPLIKEAESFDHERKAAGLSFLSFGRRMPWLSVIIRLVVGIALMPFLLFAAILSSPMWLLSAHIIKGLKDKAFTKTVHFGVKFAMMPLLVIIWALVFFLCLPFKLAIVLFLLALGSHTIFYEALERGRILVSDIRLLFGHKELKNKYARLSSKVRAIQPIYQTEEI